MAEKMANPRRKRIDHEGPIHRAIVQYLRSVLPPECIVHHSANEGVRGGKKGALDGAAKKAMGQTAGWPDIEVFLFSTRGPVFFEVKAPKGQLQKTQIETIKKLRNLGYRVAVVRSIDEVKTALREWSIPTREVAS